MTTTTDDAQPPAVEPISDKDRAKLVDYARCLTPDPLCGLILALDARCTQAELERDEFKAEAWNWCNDYLRVADAVANRSESSQQIADIARSTRRERDAAIKRTEELEAELVRVDECWKEMMDEAHRQCVDEHNKLNRALAREQRMREMLEEIASRMHADGHDEGPLDDDCSGCVAHGLAAAALARAEEAERETQRYRTQLEAHDKSSAAMWQEQYDRADAAMEREQRLREALTAIVSIDVQLPSGVCAWCEKRVGNGHYKNCPWRIATVALASNHSETPDSCRPADHHPNKPPSDLHDGAVIQTDLHDEGRA